MSEKASAPTHGEGLYDALRAEMIRIGRKPSRPEAVAVFNDYLAANAVKLKRKTKGTPAPRARDAVFDLLATLDGQNLAEITRAGGSKIAAAKKQILEVMPEASVEQVCEEIRVRWARLQQRFREKKMQTAPTLAKWWATLSPGEKTPGSKPDVYKEPEAWKATANELYPGSDITSRNWLDLGTDIRANIIRHL